MGGTEKRGRQNANSFLHLLLPFLFLLLLSLHFALIILVFVAAINYRRREGGKEWESGVRKRAGYNGVSLLSLPLCLCLHLRKHIVVHCIFTLSSLQWCPN